VDTRADIYSLGAVLYHMLTGQPPFTDDEPALTLTKVIHEDPRRPRDLDRSIPEGVEALIQRAMARDPAQRPAKVQDLDRLLAAFDGAARAESPAIKPAASPEGRVAIASAKTVAVSPPPSEAAELARRARGARPAALGWAVLYSLVAGGGVLVAAATIVRVVVRRVDLTETETALLGVAGAATLVLLWLAGTRAIVSRWRSAPAIERLGAGLRGALLWLVVPLAALTLGARGESIFGPALPKDVTPWVEVGVLVLPLLFGQLAFVAALWRTRRI
jgi:serine/threonine-protein kinase